MSKKIGFDLDGVLIADCDRIPNLGGPDKFYELAMYMRPLFCPKGEWSIITGRPAQFKSKTIEWVEKYFRNKPVDIFHGAKLENPAEYKAGIIMQHGFEVFVESDPAQANKIRSLVPDSVTVYHFEEFVAARLITETHK